MQSSIYISCTDSVKSRFEIADILDELKGRRRMYRNSPKYWIDTGNNLNSGQALLATIGDISQPDSEKYETVSHLPYVTQEFEELLYQSETGRIYQAVPCRSTREAGFVYQLNSGTNG